MSVIGGVSSAARTASSNGRSMFSAPFCFGGGLFFCPLRSVTQLIRVPQSLTFATE